MRSQLVCSGSFRQFCRSEVTVVALVYEVQHVANRLRIEVVDLQSDDAISLQDDIVSKELLCRSYGWTYATVAATLLCQYCGVGADEMLVSLDLLAVADDDEVSTDRIVAHLCDACKRRVGHVVWLFATDGTKWDEDEMEVVCEEALGRGNRKAPAARPV